MTRTVRQRPVDSGRAIAAQASAQSSMAGGSPRRRRTGIGRAIEGSRGMRCYGAAALEMAEVAAGGAVVYAQPRLQPWDVAAGALLCAETGAALTRMDGAPFDVRRAGSLLVGTPAAHAEVLRHLRAVGD